MLKPFHVGNDDENLRLDRWFKRHRPDVPHGLLQKLLRKGFIRLDGKKAETSTHVMPGQIITIREDVIPAKREVKEKKTNTYRVTDADKKIMRDAILYENDDMFVLNKPAGLAVQGGTGQSKSLDDMLFALSTKENGKPRLVHRLDMDTSGVIVVAKTQRSAAYLTKLFRERKVTKLYWALIVGTPIPREGMIDLPMAKRESGKDSRMEKVEIDEDEGKAAKTRYKVVYDLGAKFAWVELEPITGRTHQLRVHMAAINHPIVGDGKYGGPEAFIGGTMNISKKLHLHARSIEIPDCPLIEASLPAHMQETWELLNLEELL